MEAFPLHLHQLAFEIPAGDQEEKPCLRGFGEQAALETLGHRIMSFPRLREPCEFAFAALGEEREFPGDREGLRLEEQLASVGGEEFQPALTAASLK